MLTITTFLAWASFDMTVPKALTDLEQYFYAQVAVNFGTPSQTIPLTVDLSSDLLAVFSEDCDLCGGSTFFDQTESSTFQVRGTNLHLLCPFCRSADRSLFIYLAYRIPLFDVPTYTTLAGPHTILAKRHPSIQRVVCP